MALHLALLLTLLEILALSGVLLLWAKQVAGSRLLVVFLLGVAVWIVGNELPNWFGLAHADLAMVLLSSLPLTSAAFWHFCAMFCEVPLHRRWLWAGYALALLGVGVSLLWSPGQFIHHAPFAGMQWVVMPNAVGWTTSLIWGTLALAGLGTLAWGFFRTPSRQRRKQMAAIAASCAWGLLAMSGFAFVSFQLPYYPWPVLLMPVFPLMLVYGVLRYRVFVVNVWARRALASAILVLLGLGVVSLTVLLPVESKWLNAVAVAAVCLTLGGPVWRFAARLVYPGGTPSAEDLRHWRQALSTADSHAQLAQTAAELLSARMGTAVQVRQVPQEAATPPFSPNATHHETDLSSIQPLLLSFRREAHHTQSVSDWHTALHGFDEAPPGQRHLAELFANTLADAAAQVDLAQQARQREREQQLQARLAELGSLAATVAHDVRNPLNIIAMAVAMAPPETRQEVGEQIARISHLTEDLLDYAKPWQLQPVPTDLHQRTLALLRHHPHIETAPELTQPCWLMLDPARFDQALGNLLANASTAASMGNHPSANAPQRRVRVESEVQPDAVLLHVCDDGPGIPPDMRERLFQPFASRSPGGTGLGLAIVARIMAAHGGSAQLGERPPWRTCLTLRFPCDEAATPALSQPSHHLNDSGALPNAAPAFAPFAATAAHPLTASPLTNPPATPAATAHAMPASRPATRFQAEQP